MDAGADRPEQPPGDSPGAEQPPGDSHGTGQPSEEELRARLEEELRKVRAQDLLLQSVASLVNLTARRIAKEDERDLEQARVGIDAIRALVELLDAEPQSQVRNALSELQMLFAQQSRGGAPEGEPAKPAAAGEDQGPEPKRPSGLWTPPGTTSG
jgi:hypothetical protein